MPLVQCPDCGKDVSDQAPACPHCGRPMRTPVPMQTQIEKQKTGCFTWFAAIIFAIFFFFIIVSECPSYLDIPDGISSAEKTVNPGPDTQKSTSGVTLANFKRLKTGMTYQQVVALLGKEGTEMSRVGDPGLGIGDTVMYSWTGKGFIGANMNAMFQGGKLEMKAQFGLR